MSSHFLKVLISIVALVLSGCGGLSTKPPSVTGPLNNFTQYQSELAGYFNERIGRPNNMRVVPASIIYPVGTVIRRDSMSQLSKKCSFDPQSLQSPTLGPDVPSVISSKKIKLGIDPGSLISKGIKQLDALKLNYDEGVELTATVTEVSTQMLDEDEVLGVIQNPECLTVVQAKDVSVIRGYISARYGVSAGGGIDAGAKATVLKAELVDITYQDKNKFEMKETSATQKFVILSDGRIEKGVDLSGGFLQSTENEGCSEISFIAFDPPNKKPVGTFRSLREFSSCKALQSYIERLCKKPETHQACQDQMNHFQMEVNGVKF